MAKKAKKARATMQNSTAQSSDQFVVLQRDLELVYKALATLIAKGLTPEELLKAGPTAAEMLVHFGRGQMAAEQNLSFTTADVPTIVTGGGSINGTEIFDRTGTPGVVERMFSVFTKSIAATNQVGVFAASSTVRNRVCAYSFLLGNLSWQQRGASPNLTADNVKGRLEQIKTSCPPPSTAGGGEFCHLGPF